MYAMNCIFTLIIFCRRDRFVMELQSQVDLSVTDSMEEAELILDSESFIAIICRFVADGRLPDFVTKLIRSGYHAAIFILVSPEDKLHHIKELSLCMERGSIGYFENSLDKQVLFQRLFKLLQHVTATKMTIGKPKRGLDKQLSKAENDDECHKAAINIIRKAKGRRAGVQRLESPMDVKIRTSKQRSKSTTILRRRHSMVGLGLSDNHRSSIIYANIGANSPASRNLMYADPAKYQLMIQKKEYLTLIKPLYEAELGDPVLGKCVSISPAELAHCSENSLPARAFQLYSASRYDEAKKLCFSAISNGKQLKSAHYVLGLVHHATGDFSSAIKSFTLCIKLDAKFHQACFNRGIGFLQIGHDARGKNAIEKASKLKPKNQHYVETLALIHRRQQNYCLSEEYCRNLKHHKAVTQSVTDDADTTYKTNLHNELKRHKMPSGVYDQIFSSSKGLTSAFTTTPEKRSLDMLKDITNRLLQIPLVKSFPESSLACFSKNVNYGIIQIGSSFDLALSNPTSVYIVLSGQLAGRRGIEMFAKCSVTICRYIEDDIFGELGLSLPTLETLVAEEVTEVLWLPKRLFEEFIKPVTLQQRKDIYKCIEHLPIFKDLSKHDIGHLSNRSKVSFFQEGQEIISQGFPVQKLYVLRKGICSGYQSSAKWTFDLIDEHKRLDDAVPTPFHHQVRKLDQAIPRSIRHHRPSSSSNASAPQNLFKPTERIFTTNDTDKANDQTLIITYTAPDVFGDTAVNPPQRSHAKAYVPLFLCFK